MSTARRTISSAINCDPPEATLQLAERYERPMKQLAVVAFLAGLTAPAVAQSLLGNSPLDLPTTPFKPPVAATYALPDPTMTPGAVDAGVSLERICNGTTKERRRVSPAIRAKVLRDYSVTDAGSVAMELDHLVPLALGARTPRQTFGRSPGPRPTSRIASSVRCSGAPASPTGR